MRHVLLWAAILGAAQITVAAETAAARIVRPRAWEVIQREGFAPATAHENHPGGPTVGWADVRIEAELAGNAGAEASCRAVPLTGAFGGGMDWTTVAGRQAGTRWTGVLRVPAGGWYRLEVCWRSEGRQGAAASVEPFGPGEVFLVAGQSYAGGSNDELLKVGEPHGRVVAYDVRNKSWQTAHDPQPHVGPGGTIWPPLGDTLVPLLRTPVGLVNVSVGATSSRQWMPGGPLWDNLVAAGVETGRFRAVLWQQGESDVIEKTTTEKYVENLTAIRKAAARRWGFEPPWLLAKSTLHPAVYKEPAQERAIREAIDRLCRQSGFRRGPDTDILGGENRGGMNTFRHFSPIGQRRAAAMWFAAIWQELNREE
jgi:hypothetical protein